MKILPLCPASTASDGHPLALKTLVSVKFTTAKSTSPAEETTLICPACNKGLSNTLKAMLAVPCGHVTCKPCAGKFVLASKAPVEPSAAAPEDYPTCFVCDADLRNSHDEKGGGKAALTPGLVEIKSEGTGFAGGGTNMAKRQGIAFQC